MKIEDGQRLSSLQSLKASNATSETVVEEFASLVSQLDLSARDEQVFEAIETMWNEATERFNLKS